MDSGLVERFRRDMTDMLRRLRARPAQILWRSYSPSHFGGELGSFVLHKEGQGREQQDQVSPHQPVMACNCTLPCSILTCCAHDYGHGREEPKVNISSPPVYYGNMPSELYALRAACMHAGKYYFMRLACSFLP